MKPYCGIKGKFLTESEIKKYGCDKSNFLKRCKFKEKLRGEPTHFWSCKYFIVKKSPDAFSPVDGGG